MTIPPQVLYQQGHEALIIYRAFAKQWVLENELTHFLQSESIVLQHNKITVFGKEYNEPRLTFWMGPSYRYSSIQWTRTPFSSQINQWKGILTQHLNFEFNSVLLNLYRNGEDSMGKHRDNEPEMDSSCIASLSFGASREIIFDQPHTGQKIKLLLEHGDLLVMKNFQDTWWHSVPKRKRINQPRLNLTFRKILTYENN
jgi:alkylated DNA repair dioxygenase AlkB